MAVLLQVDFPFEGPWNEKMSSSMRDLAESINEEDGFIWKIWTENQEMKESGGVYLFQNLETAQRYLKMHTDRLLKFGIGPVNAKFFDINKPLSELNKVDFIP